MYQLIISSTLIGTASDYNYNVSHYFAHALASAISIFYNLTIIIHNNNYDLRVVIRLSPIIAIIFQNVLPVKW